MVKRKMAKPAQTKTRSVSLFECWTNDQSITRTRRDSAGEGPELSSNGS